MNRAVLFATGNNAVGTPRDFYQRLHGRCGGFVADMAADQQLALHESWYGPDHPDPARRDCLTVDWPTHGPVFLNPPYGATERPCRAGCTKKRCRERGTHLAITLPGCEAFVAKAAAERLRGVETWALLAARTDVGWFHDHLWDATIGRTRIGVRVEFLKGRLTFLHGGADDPAPFPSMIVRFLPSWR